jgi:hypothetical protein
MLTMFLVDYLDRLKLPNGDTVRLRCYSFAGPPIATLNLARQYNEYVSTFVVEDDIVCRLSYGHMMDLKSLIICAVEAQRQQASVILEFWKGIFGADQKFSSGFAPAINSIAAYRERMRNGSHKQRHIKLFLVGKIFHFYYEDPKRKPFASLIPKYSDLKSRSTASLSTTPEPSDVDPPLSAPIESTATTSSPSEESPRNEKSPEKSETKPYKKVYVECNTPENFDEIIVKRTMFLEHIPNAYDKAFERAFETLMMDLAESQDVGS